MHLCTSLWMPQPLFLSALNCWKSLVVSRDHAFLSIPFYLIAWCQAYGSMAEWERETLCHCGTILHLNGWLISCLKSISDRICLFSPTVCLQNQNWADHYLPSFKSWFPSSFLLFYNSSLWGDGELPSLLGFLLTYWEILIYLKFIKLKISNMNTMKKIKGICCLVKSLDWCCF